MHLIACNITGSAEVLPGDTAVVFVVVGAIFAAGGVGIMVSCWGGWFDHRGCVACWCVVCPKAVKNEKKNL